MEISGFHIPPNFCFKSVKLVAFSGYCFCKSRKGLGCRGWGCGFAPHKWNSIANIYMCSCITRNFGKIVQKSRPCPRHFPAAILQPVIAAKGGSNFYQFPISPGGCVNGARNAVSLAAIRTGKRVVCRVDGLAEILVRPPSNNGLPSTISRGARPDPNQS